MGNQTLLPTADTLERYLAIRGDHARLRPGVTALCDRLGLHGVDIRRFTDGSLPVYAVGEQRVLKLYPGAFQHGYQVERLVLHAIHRQLPIPTPGSATGWPPSSARPWRHCTPSPRRSWPRSGRPTGTCLWPGSGLGVSTTNAQPAWTAPGWSRSRRSSTA
jgi:hygromycin-B 7''-O-kinase